MNIQALTSHRLFKLALLFFVSIIFLGVLSMRTAFAQSVTKPPKTPIQKIPSPKPPLTKPPAVSPSPSAPATVQSVTDLKFPIDDLGGCNSFNSCNTFCQDPVNYNTCAEYAKKHGFYKDDKVLAADDKFWQKTKDALGCDSEQSCRDFCANSTNLDKCDAFSKKEDLVGGFVKEPDKPEVLAKAKEALGCDSADACTALCSNSTNAKKCTAFADEVGLVGGEVKQGPGGCTSETTCKNFCSDPNNFEKCKPFAPPNAEFHGPGGCTDPQGCRSFCETNPDSCRSYAPGSNGRYVPVSCPQGQFFGPGGACTPVEKTDEAAQCAMSGKFWSGKGCQEKAPEGIASNVGGAFFQPRPDMGNCKTPGECYDYCKANAGKCGGFADTGQRPPDTYVPTLYYTPGTIVKHEPIKEMGNCTTAGECYDFCKSNPSKCQGFDSKAPRPVDTFAPGTYYTPPANFAYVTPPTTNFYVTPVYYTPPEGSNYTTPSYYTPGQYYTPNYYTPPTGSNYTTPNYYTPGTTYYTPANGATPPPYTTPQYYTPPVGSNYTTPQYYTPANYTTPTYYTPPAGSNYTTPQYPTPSQYTTPQYYTPPAGSTYTSPTYYTPGTYYTPNYGTPTNTGGYYYPTPSSGTYGTPSTTTGYSYPTPSYGTPGGSYPTPSYGTPGGSYATPSYPTPSYNTPSYGTPSYPTPSYNTPSYNTPSYNTPSYNTPAYNTPSYSTPPVQGASTKLNFLQKLWYVLTGR